MPDEVRCAYLPLETGHPAQPADGTLQGEPRGLREGYTNTSIAIGVALIFFFGTLLGNYAEELTRGASCSNKLEYGSYERGFSTERLLPASVIRLKMKRFGGNPMFLANGTEIVQLDLTQPVYVGEPSQEIDHAWNRLIFGRYFNISLLEAQQLWGDKYLNYADERDGSFTGGFDVFHSLHCLNELRKRLSPEYYPRTELHGKVHDRHCINHLRQVLQCSSVASIIPSLYRPLVGIQYSDAAQPHVCRDFDRIREFSRRRYYEGPEVL